MESIEEEQQTLDVTIERLLPGGVGLAHADGLTLFVSLAAPEDIVRVRIDRVSGKVVFASIVEIIKPSPVRIEPPCPYFGLCGGCDFQQLNYEAQLSAKVEIIRDCLHRIAKIEAPLDIPIHASPKPWQYRARATWQFDRSANRLGYFIRGSNDVCDVEYCAVLVPELQQALEQLRNEIPSGQLPKHIDAVSGDEGVSVAVRNVEVSGNNAPTITRRIGNETYHFSAEGFFQVNHDLLEPLIGTALGDAVGRTAIDLYCGVGLFTLPLARRFERVIGVEANPLATDFARRNIESAGLARRGTSPTVSEGSEGEGTATPATAEIVTARVGDWLRQHSVSLGPVDFLLLDPPRTGAENKDIAGILSLRPTQISYVSCDPATLARDLKKLMAAGYSLDSVAAFDMFPQTHHVETIARLSATSV
ncbi:MAG TPA: class I SAM-dependent RNA methyltransferase [Pyrinomonadaceae bacterium]|nr:class I SAM-dependent RNA methyltransferase [Pyrinomonadaceae bacterium]